MKQTTILRISAILGVALLSPLGAQSASEEPLGHGYSREGEFNTFAGERIDRAGRKDLADFARHLGQDLTLCADVHAPSFVAHSEQYTADRAMVYYKWISPGKFWVVQLPEADVSTFEVLGFNLARDKKSVWWYGSVLPDLDPQTVEIVREGFVWKDAKRVWYQHAPIEGADPATFEHLARGFYRDARQAYWCRTPLEGADPRTFRTFGDESAYAVDARTVWKAAARLEGPHAPSFEPVHRAVYIDRNGVFERPGAPIEGADIGTFRKAQDLDKAGTALFWDAHADYVYLPYRGEVYRVQLRGDSLEVTRSIWSKGTEPSLRAKATAVLTESGWSTPAITLKEGRSKRKLLSEEAHLLEIHQKVFQRVRKLLEEPSRVRGENR